MRRPGARLGRVAREARRQQAAAGQPPRGRPRAALGRIPSSAFPEIPVSGHIRAGLASGLVVPGRVPPPIGANLPDWVLVRPFSWWLAEMAADILRGSKQGAHVRLGSDGFDERLDNEA